MWQPKHLYSAITSSSFEPTHALTRFRKFPFPVTVLVIIFINYFPPPQTNPNNSESIQVFIDSNVNDTEHIVGQRFLATIELTTQGQSMKTCLLYPVQPRDFCVREVSELPLCEVAMLAQVLAGRTSMCTRRDHVPSYRTRHGAFRPTVARGGASRLGMMKSHIYKINSTKTHNTLIQNQTFPFIKIHTNVHFTSTILNL